MTLLPQALRLRTHSELRRVSIAGQDPNRITIDPIGESYRRLSQGQYLDTEDLVREQAFFWIVNYYAGVLESGEIPQSVRLMADHRRSSMRARAALPDVADVVAVQHWSLLNYRPFRWSFMAVFLGFVATAIVAPLYPMLAIVPFFATWVSVSLAGYYANFALTLRHGEPVINPRYIAAAFVLSCAFTVEALLLALAHS